RNISVDLWHAFDQMIRDSSLRSECQENTREATDQQLAANPQFSSRRAVSHRRLWRARFRRAAPLADQSRLQETDRLPSESPTARTIQRRRCALRKKTRYEIRCRS